MRVADETELFESLENADEFAGIGVNVVGENVFVDWTPRGCVDGNQFRGFQPHGQVAEELPSFGPADGVGIILEALPGPVASLLRPAIEIERFVKDGEIVVSHERCAAAGDDQVEAL